MNLQQQQEQQWSLKDLETMKVMKDKDGNLPSSDTMKFIQKLSKNSLLPCPRSVDELEMPRKKDTTPREMNSFIIFRRHLSLVAKEKKISDDGKVISRAASLIWHVANEIEKKSYKEIAKELKERHYKRYPNYSYERRKRKTAEEDFILVNVIDAINKPAKKRARKTTPQTSVSTESTFVHVSEERQLVPVVSTSSQGQVIGELYNPLNILPPQAEQEYYCNSLYDNSCYSFSDDMIPQLTQTIMASNYLNMEFNDISLQNDMALLLQQQQQQQQQQEQLQQHLSPPLYSLNFFNGDSDGGMNQQSNSELFSLYGR